MAAEIDAAMDDMNRDYGDHGDEGEDDDDDGDDDDGAGEGEGEDEEDLDDLMDEVREGCGCVDKVR